MKVVITGNSSGIGKALAKKFSDNGHEVVGFGITNGYDLSIPEVREVVANELKTSDVFINNAMCEQLPMLERACEVWDGEDKLIINISSAVLYGHMLYDLNADETYDNNNQLIPKDYIIAKKKLSKFVMLHNVGNKLPKIMDVMPGWTNTPLAVAAVGKNIATSKMIDPDVLSDVVYSNFLHWPNICVYEVVIAPQG